MSVVMNKQTRGKRSQNTATTVSEWRREEKGTQVLLPCRRVHALEYLEVLLETVFGDDAQAAFDEVLVRKAEIPPAVGQHSASPKRSTGACDAYYPDRG